MTASFLLIISSKAKHHSVNKEVLELHVDLLVAGADLQSPIHSLNVHVGLYICFIETETAPLLVLC